MPPSRLKGVIKMHNFAHIAKKSMGQLSSATTKRIIKQFAAKYQLVYFGSVNPQDDDYNMVRGVTVSVSHTDNHYTVGSYQGHDIILVERRNSITFPGKERSNYRWLIMQIDLRQHNLPHLFIDTKHHDKTFYATAFMGANNLQDMTAYFAQVSPAFAGS